MTKEIDEKRRWMQEASEIVGKLRAWVQDRDCITEGEKEILAKFKIELQKLKAVLREMSNSK